MTKHLWQFDHPFYADPGDHCILGTDLRFGDWAEFIASREGTDPDRDVLWRWDWLPGLDGGHDTVWLFYVAQGKAIRWSAQIAVTRQDESAVRAFLAERAAYLHALWAPLLPADLAVNRPAADDPDNCCPACGLNWFFHDQQCHPDDLTTHHQA